MGKLDSLNISLLTFFSFGFCLCNERSDKYVNWFSGEPQQQHLNTCSLGPPAYPGCLINALFLKTEPPQSAVKGLGNCFTQQDSARVSPGLYVLLGKGVSDTGVRRKKRIGGGEHRLQERKGQSTEACWRG